jgi:hypothetical protein
MSMVYPRINGLIKHDRYSTARIYDVRGLWEVRRSTQSLLTRKIKIVLGRKSGSKIAGPPINLHGSAVHITPKDC